VHPVLFEIPISGGVYIFSYGVMLGLSFVMGWQFVMHFGVKHENVERKILETCFIVTAVSAIVGGRLLYVLTNLEAFEEQPFYQLFNLRAGGMVAYGGFLGGAVGAAVYLRLFEALPDDVVILQRLARALAQVLPEGPARVLATRAAAEAERGDLARARALVQRAFEAAGSADDAPLRRQLDR